MNPKLDFLAIGDITTDAFIKLVEASVHCDINKEKCQICMSFAEKIPYDSVTIVRAVGNAPNAAVSASRLGLRSGLVTNMGDDENGRECLEVLKEEKVDTSYVAVHEGKPTNYHYVLSYQAERTILIKHEEYEYKFPEITDPPKLIYLSSFRGTDAYLKEIEEYLENNPAVRVAFQPGKFEIKLGTDKFKKIYARSEMFFCNREEAMTILKTEDSDVKKLLVGINALGPKIVCVTDGPKGAYAFDARFNEFLFEPPFPDPKPPENRTGAGDAFASTFVSAILIGKPVSEALRYAGVNSAFVVQQIGAQKGLLERKELEKKLSEAPENYKPKDI